MNVIELAKEAGFNGHSENHVFIDIKCIERFAALVRAEALEKAAKVCDTEEIHRGNWFAAAIRGLK